MAAGLRSEREMLTWRRRDPNQVRVFGGAGRRGGAQACKSSTESSQEGSPWSGLKTASDLVVALKHS